MKALEQLAGKTAGLLGFGRSNLALLDFLLAHGMKVTVHDRKQVDQDYLLARGVAVRTGDGYLDDLHEDYLFRSPGIRPDLEPIAAAVARGARLSGEYDLFASLCPATLLGVTGSDGKTTTTTLAGHMLAAGGKNVHVGGNIGQPLIAKLSMMQKEDLALAEISSFQLMTAPRPPQRAIITNITENHLNWHRDMAEYVWAKERILGPGTHAILHAENPYTAAIAHRRADKTIFSAHADASILHTTFGTCHTVTVEGGWICYDSKPLLAAKNIRLPGVHNLENYLAAIGLVYPYLKNPIVIDQVARSFGGVPHRLEHIATIDGVTYYNSSIDSTPVRTAAAISALHGKLIVLCGGADKELSFIPLRAAFRQKVGTVILFGQAREKLYAALAGLPIRIEQRHKMAEAIVLARHIAQPGDIVLLSPACTSFDEFQNFEERGELFRHIVLGFQQQRRKNYDESDEK